MLLQCAHDLVSCNSDSQHNSRAGHPPDGVSPRSHMPIFSLVVPCQPGAALRDLRHELLLQDTSVPRKEGVLMWSSQHSNRCVVKETVEVLGWQKHVFAVCG